MQSPLHGQMMDMPLLISSFMTHAARHFPGIEIVSRRHEGDLHRYTYRDAEVRMRQMASALERRGIEMGERVATLAWNGYRHMEAYYAVGGKGSIVHTINPRLHPDQIAWIVNHAEDSMLCFDLSFLPIVESIAPRCPSVKHWVAMCDPDHMPRSAIPNLLCFESLLAEGDPHWQWPEFDERSAVASATPPAPPVTRRAPSMRTVQPCCMPMRQASRMPCAFRHAMWCFRSCRCFM